MFNRALISSADKIMILILIALISQMSIACKDKPPEASANAKRYEIKGKVVSADIKKHEVTIDHEEIPGYMEKMTMPFTLHEEWVYGELTPGALIQATLVVDGAKSWLENPIVTRIADPSLVKSEETGIEPSPGRQTPDFTLVNQDGKRIALNDYRGSNLVLTFIYTRCPLPDYCPLMSENFVAIHQSIQKNPALRDKVRLLSISIDPDYDKPSVLRDYGSRYLGSNKPDAFKRWEFATGASEEIKSVARFFGLNYWPENDQVIHGLRTSIIDPDGKVHRVYRGNTWKPEDILKDLESMSSSDRVAGGR